MISNLQVYLNISFQEWSLVDNCLTFVEGYIERTSEMIGKPLDSRDKYFVQWIRRVREKLEQQAQETTSDSDSELLVKEIKLATEVLPELLKVLEGVNTGLLMYFKRMAGIP